MNAFIKTLGAIAIAGTVAAGGSAFTAGGIVNTAAADPLSGFIGGTVTQTSTGATLSNVVYDFTNNGTAQEAVTDVHLTFTTTVFTRTVTVTLNNTALTAPETITCAVLVGSPTLAECPTADPVAGFADLQALNVQVAA